MLPKQGEIVVTLTYEFPYGSSISRRKVEKQVLEDCSALSREIGKHLAPKLVEVAASLGDDKE